MPRQIRLIGSLLLCSAAAPQHATEPFHFNAGFLSKTEGEVDLERFILGIPLSAGRYPSDLYVNRQWVGHEEINLKETGKGDEVALCFDETLLRQAKIKPSLISPELKKRLRDPAECVTKEQIDPGIQWHYQMSSLTLELTVPQSQQNASRREEIDPHSAQTGATVATLGYNFNSYHSGVNDGSQDNRYLGLNGGANLGSWRLRHQSSLHQNNSDTPEWNNIATYAERSLVDWESHLRLGQGWTTGEFFDSMGYQGVSLATDSRMLPSSRRGFAPTVRGNAHTHARVTIEQNGNLLYETTVPPGNFVIDDLYPTGYGGDLQVTIHEADGQQQQFRIPYASVPGLVRDGNTFYSATLGQLHENGLTKPEPTFGEFTLQHGFNNLLTGYGGINAMDDYSALLLGSALNTPWGAFSLDATHSSLDDGQSRQQGTRYRGTYNKTLSQSGTQLSLNASRSSDEGYFSPREAMMVLDDPDASTTHEQKRLDINLNQPINSGNLYLIGSKSWYWDEQTPLQSLQLGYSNSIGSVSYQLGVQHNQDSTGEEDQIYTLSLSMPLGNRSSLNMQLNHDPHNGNQMQSSLTGVAGEASELSYGITATHDASNEQGLTSVGGNASYRSSAAYLSGSTSRDSNHQQQYSLGLRGAVVAHSGGVIATPDLGDTFAIVEAPAAEGAGVANRQGNRIDSAGYAIVPYLTPFESNRLDLDPEGMPETVELSTTSMSVIPDAGAAVKVTFPTRIGYGLLMETHLPDGKSTPFGADVLGSSGHEVGSVGQGGQLYARVRQRQGALIVRWGKRPDQQCQIAYQLPASASGLTTLPDTHLCQPSE